MAQTRIVYNDFPTRVIIEDVATGERTEYSHLALVDTKARIIAIPVDKDENGNVMVELRKLERNELK